PTQASLAEYHGQARIDAKLRDFYAAEGVDVEVRALPSGRQALEALFAGQCALTAAAETPVAHYSLTRSDFAILAAISVSSNFERMVVRTDRGIRGPADFKGRRIAVPQFTSAHYFLDMYLVASNLRMQDVLPVFLPATEVVTAFQRGDVDVAVLWEPMIQNLSSAMGAKARVIALPGLHVSPFLLVGTRTLVQQHPELIERVLRALLRAERLAREQPDVAKGLMAQSYSLTPAEADMLWRQYDFRVALDQSLPFILENAARWDLSALPMAQRPPMPNYLDFIYVDGLMAVKPAAITLIH
ncbi:ABC transporter substrate-binding protein, partial [Roseateles sp. GG27B]